MTFPAQTTGAVVVRDVNGLEAPGGEEGITAAGFVGSNRRTVAPSIYLNSKPLRGEEEVGDVRPHRSLKEVVIAALQAYAIQRLLEAAFSGCSLRSAGAGKALGSALGRAKHVNRVLLLHALGNLGTLLALHRMGIVFVAQNRSLTHGAALDTSLRKPALDYARVYAKLACNSAQAKSVLVKLNHFLGIDVGAHWYVWTAPFGCNHYTAMRNVSQEHTEALLATRWDWRDVCEVAERVEAEAKQSVVG